MGHFTWKTAIAGAALIAGCVLTSSTALAGKGDSIDINRLLGDANDEAIQLRADAEMMASFTRSNLTWETYATQLSMIKEHVNKTGKIVASLTAERANGTPWQQTAIDRIHPLLREMAANTESVISYLDKNHTRIHMKSFQDYVQANADAATQLSQVIGDFTDYGNTKSKLEWLAAKLELDQP